MPANVTALYFAAPRNTGAPEKNEITILYNEDHEIRRVRLNAQHPARVIPTWYGDSVGHFEGDILVVDTIGIKVGPYSMIDSYGTPQSEVLHLVERYQLIDYDAAQAAAQRSERENRRLGSILGNGVDIDPDYRGKALQVRFTVEDQNVFTMPWSAISPIGELPMNGANAFAPRTMLIIMRG